MSTFDPTLKASASPRGLSSGWLALLTALVAVGFGAWIYQLEHGLIVTGMRDVVSWGLYICTFAFFVGLSAGGLIMASASEVFGIKSLRPLARLGVMSAAACVLVAAITIIPDLGRPGRVLNMFIYPNWSSPLIWDVTIILAYLIFACVDLFFMTRTKMDSRRRAHLLRILAYVGLPGAVLLHSVTAWIFGVQIARPWWNTALLAPVFVTSAILSGTALIALVGLAAQRFGSFQIPEISWEALRKLIVVALLIDLFLVASDYVTVIWGNVPRERAALDQVLPGGSWQWVFWLEWVVGGLIPLLLLTLPRLRRRPAVLASASLLVLAGVYAFRVELIDGGLIRPLLSFAPGIALGAFHAGQSSFQFAGVYHPTWVEYAIVTGLVALLAMLITLGYRWLHGLDPSGELR